MKIRSFYFDIEATPTKKPESEEEKEQVKAALIEFSNKLRHSIEVNLKDAEVKRREGVQTYRNNKYSALISPIGGFVRTIGEQEISEKDLTIIESIFNPICQDIATNLFLYPHLLFQIEGDFNNILEKFSLRDKFKKIDKNVDIEHCGLILTFLDNKNIPILIEVFPKKIDTKIHYCVLFTGDKKVTKIELEILEKLKFIEDRINEMGK